MDITVLQIIISAVCGGAFIGFIEFLIKRHDEKNDKNKEILEAVDKLDKKVDERFDLLDGRIKTVANKVDERAAVSARVRILKFSDELQEGRMHSKDSYDQCISDITYYEKYCSENPKFKNGQTELTVDYIKHNYAERLEKHDFL
jgi:hypothetical protein